MRRLVTVCAMFFVVAYSANRATATLWTESGDAGEVLGTAQAVLGSGPLEIITGTYGNSDADMYKIYISDPSGFSAHAYAWEDPALFLFDESGIGVYANDDRNIYTYNPYLPPGDLNGPTSAGIYYLAVSGWDRDPYSAGGPIFPDVPFTDVHGPTGAGGGSPITYWSGSAIGDDYGIYLTGAQYVPAPGAALLGILGLGAAGIKLRKFA